MITRKGSILGIIAVVFCIISLGAAKPARGPHSGLGNKQKPSGNKLTGYTDLIDGNINFDELSPKDCGTYLCVAQPVSAATYIESGCPGSFSQWQSENVEDMEVGEVLAETVSYEETRRGGVTAATLVALCSASGVLAAGAGFAVGYKNAPGFAYRRIPSIG